MHVARRLDRAGTLDIGEIDPVSAIEILTTIPRSVIEIGWPLLVTHGVFSYDRARIIMLNFVEAQEATASLAERQRRYKERSRLTVKSNETLPAGNETLPNGNKKYPNGNENKRAVTPDNENNPIPCHAVPCRAIPCCTNSPEPSVSNEIKKSGTENTDDNLDWLDSSRLAEIIDKVRRRHGATPYVGKNSDYQKRVDAVEEILAIAKSENVPPDDIARKSYENFITSKDAWLHNKGYPLGAWTQSVGHYFRPPKPIEVVERDDAPTGRAAVYERDTGQFEEKLRREKEILKKQDPSEISEAMSKALDKIKKKRF